MVDLRPSFGGAKSAANTARPGEANGEVGMLAVLPQSIRGSVSAISAWIGAGTALIGASVGVVIVLMTWVLDTADYGTSVGAIKAGLLTYVAAHHGGVEINGLHIGFAPLGLVLLPVWLCWRGGQGLGSVLVSLRADEEGLLPISVVRRAWLVASASYAIVVVGVSVIARIGTTRATVPSVALAALLLGLVGFAAGLHRGAGLFDLLVMRLGWRVVAAVRAGVGAAAVLVAAGALLALGSLLAHAGSAIDLSRALGGGAGGFPLAVLGALCVPNAALAGVAYLSGPGFAVGSGTHVSAFETSHGTVPAFPLLAALPTGNGANFVVLAMMLLTPVVAGWTTVSLLLRSGRWSVLTLCCAAAGAGACAGFVLAVVSGLAGGSLGDNGLATVGASPWRIGVVVAAEVAVLAVVVALGRSIWAMRAASTALTDGASTSS